MCIKLMTLWKVLLIICGRQHTINNTSQSVIDKFYTHSLQGLFNYAKFHFIQNYKRTCTTSIVFRHMTYFWAILKQRSISVAIFIKQLDRCWLVQVCSNLTHNYANNRMLDFSANCLWFGPIPTHTNANTISKI